jgi:hypothetical protein
VGVVRVWEYLLETLVISLESQRETRERAGAPEMAIWSPGEDESGCTNFGASFRSSRSKSCVYGYPKLGRKVREGKRVREAK